MNQRTNNNWTLNETGMKNVCVPSQGGGGGEGGGEGGGAGGRGAPGGRRSFVFHYCGAGAARYEIEEERAE